MGHITVLVTGGAGYIGAHFVNQLRQHDVSIVVIDNFSQGKNNLINDKKISYIECDLRDKTKLGEIFSKYKFDLVVHFAALASVPDSVANPIDYYETNIVGGLNLLQNMKEVGVSKIIFSSSASVYGEPVMEEITEDHPKNPTNPYGFTKLMFENILQQYHIAYGLDSVSLRYFCAAGCSENLEIGEYHKPETHVIPCIIQTVLQKRDVFYVFGNDYKTADGTGIRDYIHVDDLAQGHIKAIEKLLSEDKVCAQYNLGIGKGFSVMELIKSAEEISGKKVNYEIKPRRPGDPSKLIANSLKAQKELNWSPKFLQIKDIIKPTYNFFSKK